MAASLRAAAEGDVELVGVPMPHGAEVHHALIAGGLDVFALGFDGHRGCPAERFVAPG